MFYSYQPTITITANNKSRTYGDANPSFTYGSAGFIDGDNTGTSISNTPSLTTTADNTSDVGGYTIIGCSGYSMTSPLGYAFTFENGTLTIAQRNLTIMITASRHTVMPTLRLAQHLQILLLTM